MYSFTTTLLIGFLIGVFNQLLRNGPHLACCHTIKSLTCGAVMLGAYNMILFPVYYYLLSYLLGNFITSNMILAILSAILSSRTIEELHFRRRMQNFEFDLKKKFKFVKVDDSTIKMVEDKDELQ